MLPGNLSEHLFVYVIGIEGDINSVDSLVDEGLHPMFGLGAVEGVADVVGQRVAEILQVGNQLFQRGFIFGAKFLPRGIAFEENFVFVPSGEGEAAKPQSHFLTVRGSVGANGLWAEGDGWCQCRGGTVEEELRFAARRKPGGYVAGCARVHALQRFPLRIEFVDLDGEAFVECAETVCADG